MQEQASKRGDPVGPLDWSKVLPFKPVSTSDDLGWAGIEAARCRAEPAFELNTPAVTQHRLVLSARPPEELDLVYEGVKRHHPPSAGSIMLLPAGTPAWVRCSGHKDELHVFLEAGLVERVGAEVFDLDPARVPIEPLDGVDLPPLRSAMWTVASELDAGGAGGRLAAESLANVLAVQLIRQALAPRRPGQGRRAGRGRDVALPRRKLRAVVQYIEEHLDTALSLDEMAAVAHLSAYHFARQFKAATGVPPHQFVIARRVERAQQLLRPERELSLAEVAADAGFSDQSQFSHHFKRLVGVTPGQFRMSARTT